MNAGDCLIKRYLLASKTGDTTGLLVQWCASASTSASSTASEATSATTTASVTTSEATSTTASSSASATTEGLSAVVRVVDADCSSNNVSSSELHCSIGSFRLGELNVTVSIFWVKKKESNSLEIEK